MWGIQSRTNRNSTPGKCKITQQDFIPTWYIAMCPFPSRNCLLMRFVQSCAQSESLWLNLELGEMYQGAVSRWRFCCMSCWNKGLLGDFTFNLECHAYVFYFGCIKALDTRTSDLGIFVVKLSRDPLLILKQNGQEPLLGLSWPLHFSTF